MLIYANGQNFTSDLISMLYHIYANLSMMGGGGQTTPQLFLGKNFYWLKFPYNEFYENVLQNFPWSGFEPAFI